MLQNVLILLSIYLLLKEFLAVCHWISIIIFLIPMGSLENSIQHYFIQKNCCYYIILRLNSLYFTKTYPLSFSSFFLLYDLDEHSLHAMRKICHISLFVSHNVHSDILLYLNLSLYDKAFLY